MVRRVWRHAWGEVRGGVASKETVKRIERECFLLYVAGGGAQWHSPNGEQLAVLTRITDAHAL